METKQFKRILVAVDGSDNAARAAKLAVTLVERFGAELIVYHVIPTPSYSLAQAGMVDPATILGDYFRCSQRCKEGG